MDLSLVDKLIANKSSDSEEPEGKTGLPKGIQERTLKLILDYFKENKDWQSGDIIAEKLGLSIVTVRHYLRYLYEEKTLLADVNYETGGRPCMLYKLSK